MSEQELEQQIGSISASKLAGQLGTDERDLALGSYDMRRLTVIERRDVGILLYAKIRAKKSYAWATIYDDFLNLLVSVGGRGRRDIIRMAAVERGGVASVAEEIQRPSWVARNVYDRDWERKEKERLGIE